MGRLVGPLLEDGCGRLRVESRAGNAGLQFSVRVLLGSRGYQERLKGSFRSKLFRRPWRVVVDGNSTMKNGRHHGGKTPYSSREDRPT